MNYDGSAGKAWKFQYKLIEMEKACRNGIFVFFLYKRSPTPARCPFTRVDLQLANYIILISTGWFCFFFCLFWIKLSILTC